MRHQYRLAITDRQTGEVQFTPAQDREPRAAFTRLANDVTVSKVIMERRNVSAWETLDSSRRATALDDQQRPAEGGDQ